MTSSKFKLLGILKLNYQQFDKDLTRVLITSCQTNNNEEDKQDEESIDETWNYLLIDML